MLPALLQALACGSPSGTTTGDAARAATSISAAERAAAIERTPIPADLTPLRAGRLLPPIAGPDSAGPGLEALRGRIASRWPAFFLPDEGWQKVAGDAGPEWQIEGGAELVCLIDFSPPVATNIPGRTVPSADRPLPQLAFHFRRVADRPLRFEATWIDADDQHLDLEPEPWVQEGEDLGVRLVVPPGRVEPGSSRLVLRSTEPIHSGSVLVNFTDLPAGTRDDGQTTWGTAIAPGLRSAYDYLGDLLRFGVTGSYGEARLGGMAFIGPLRTRTVLPTKDGGTVRFRAHNAGAEPAVFHLRAGAAALRAEIGSHQQQHLELVVPPGVEVLETAVEGPAAALYLWGAPHFYSMEAEERARAPRAREADDGRMPSTLLLVTLDTTRRDALGIYGADPSPSPRLDAWAAGAAVFDQAHTTAPWTLPSHASMFTGLYPSHHGAGVSKERVDGELTTLAEYLGLAGYRRAGFVGGPLASYRYGLAQGFDFYTSPIGFETPARELTDRALAFAEASGEAPLFLFVNYFDAHLPFVPPEDLRQSFEIDARIRAIEGPWREVLEGKPSALQLLGRGELPEHPEAQAIFWDLYRAEIAEVDRQFGRLIDGLEAQGRLDDALVIVLADHGELMGENGRYSHSHTLEPELVRIPLIVGASKGAAAGIDPAGRRIEDLVSAVDVFTTILTAAGFGPEIAASAETRSDGLDLLGPSLDRRQRVVSEEHELPSVHPLIAELRIAPHLYAIHRSDTRDYWLWPDGRRCYGNRAPQRPEIPCDDEGLARARAVSEALLKAIPTTEPGNRFRLDPEERARLEALGYID